jgi:hypothetical protein
VVGCRDLVQKRGDGLAEDRCDADRQPLTGMQMGQLRCPRGDLREGLASAVEAVGQQSALAQAAGQRRVACGRQEPCNGYATCAYSWIRPRAPRSALLYPPRSGEGLGGRSLGSRVLEVSRGP